jgi:hypothetical protein
MTETEKSFPNSPINIITAKIHEAYTVACDQLLMRGYISQETRMMIGGLIGGLLQAFQTQAQVGDPNLQAPIVDPDCADAIAEKAGARHSGSDRKDLQDIHDLAVNLGADCGMSVMKQADGRYRWILVSSNAFIDRDGEIVSQKALEKDVEYADRVKEYGPLLWWHVPQLVLGECDYNAMHDKMLIESGIFYDDHMAESVKEHADTHAVSIRFFHPQTEPDRNGFFYNIRRFERSILPASAASNVLTAVPAIEKEKSMDATKMIDDVKYKALVALAGGEEAVRTALKAAEDRQKAAEAVNLSSKESKAPEDAKPETIGAMSKKDLEESVKAIVSAMMEKPKADSEKAVTELTAIKESLKAASDKDEHILKLLGDLQTAQKELSEKTKGLYGELPTAALAALLGGYRASEDSNTVTTNKELEKAAPKADDNPLLSMVDRLDGKQPAAA